MICENCDLKDINAYTPNPAKVKCTITGEFYHRCDECHLCSIASQNTIKYDSIWEHTAYDDRPVIGEVRCLVCDESIFVRAGEQFSPRICDTCKAAIMKIREA